MIRGTLVGRGRREEHLRSKEQQRERLRDRDEPGMERERNRGIFGDQQDVLCSSWHRIWGQTYVVEDIPLSTRRWGWQGRLDQTTSRCLTPETRLPLWENCHPSALPGSVHSLWFFLRPLEPQPLCLLTPKEYPRIGFLRSFWQVGIYVFLPPAVSEVVVVSFSIHSPPSVWWNIRGLSSRTWSKN